MNSHRYIIKVVISKKCWISIEQLDNRYDKKYTYPPDALTYKSKLQKNPDTISTHNRSNIFKNPKMKNQYNEESHES